MMDTFDTINFGVLLLLVALVVACRTFCKPSKPPVRPPRILSPLLQVVIMSLTLSVVHHWHAPHRRAHELWLAISASVVAGVDLAATLRAQRQEARLKQARMEQWKRECE